MLSYTQLEDQVGFEPTYTGLRVRTVAAPVTDPLQTLVGRLGFEPRFTAHRAGVLPLN